MYQRDDIISLIRKTESGINDIMLSDKSLLYLIDQTKKSLYRFDEHDNNISFSLDTGIVGRCALNGQIIDLTEPQKSEYYNLKVDLDTTLPLITLPVKNKKDLVIGVIQVLKLKSSINFGNDNSKVKVDVFEFEMMKLFLMQIAVCIENIIN